MSAENLRYLNDGDNVSCSKYFWVKLDLSLVGCQGDGGSNDPSG